MADSIGEQCPRCADGELYRSEAGDWVVCDRCSYRRLCGTSGGRADPDRSRFDIEDS